MLKERAREILKDALAEDLAWSMECDHQFCVSLARGGFGGYESMADEELVSLAIGNCLQEEDDEVMEAIDTLGIVTAE
jgi:hypothetical protein